MEQIKHNSKSLITAILKDLRAKGDWVNGGYYEEMAIKMGYKASHGDRRARDLVTEKLVVSEVRKNENTGKISVWFKAIPKDIITYTVVATGQKIEKTLW